MNNRDAIGRGMAALEERKSFTISTRQRASAKTKSEDAALDAAAWNALSLLSKII